MNRREELADIIRKFGVFLLQRLLMFLGACMQMIHFFDSVEGWFRTQA